MFLSFEYIFYIFRVVTPGWDGSVYLLNSKGWLNGTPLFENFRSPLISWIVSGIWFFSGQDWLLVKFLQAVFTVGAGVVLYLTLKNYKGSLFALGVTSLTMLNTYVFFYSTLILIHGISLFFVCLTLFFLKKDNPNYWFLGGIVIGLTFAARYNTYC